LGNHTQRSAHLIPDGSFKINGLKNKIATYYDALYNTSSRIRQGAGLIVQPFFGLNRMLKGFSWCFSGLNLIVVREVDFRFS